MSHVADLPGIKNLSSLRHRARHDTLASFEKTVMILHEDRKKQFTGVSDNRKPSEDHKSPQFAETGLD